MPFANACGAIRWHDNTVSISSPASSSCHLNWLAGMISIQQATAPAFTKLWFWRPRHQQVAEDSGAEEDKFLSILNQNSSSGRYRNLE